MAEAAPHHDDEERARRAAGSDRGPGAHSGDEKQAAPRTVPGVGSAAEGYSTGGTGEGDPLKGLIAEDATEETGAADAGAGTEPAEKSTARRDRSADDGGR